MTRRKFALLAACIAFIAACDKDATQRALEKQQNANERNGIDPGHGGGGGLGDGGGGGLGR
ncbi:hypothetical protein ACFPL7_02750 [Dongia soli]|uniref:Lipoprotein n=1 Tax=Dongia soli TaxID=600628 RepID=A0ABU5EKN5_9PROT|nr:hypothetical protein [Dongia soli]MDY0885708.1 hypothetical protein [Dongia soli]